MKYIECLTQLNMTLKKIIQNCEEKDWEALSVNEQQREKLQKQLETLPVDNSKNNIALLKETIELNKNAVVVANKNKEEAQDALLKSKRSTKKTSLYQ